MSKVAPVNEGLLLTAPHVNSAMLASRLDQTVRLVAKALTSSNGRVEVETSDGGRITVTLSSGSDVVAGQVYQFIGRAYTPAEFNELATLELGDLNMKNFEQMLQLQGQFPGLFSA